MINLAKLSLASPSASTPAHFQEKREVWFQNPHGTHPFTLAVKSRAPHASSPSFTELDFFPWGDTPFGDLWNSERPITGDNAEARWVALRSKWRNTVAICGGSVVRVVKTSPPRHGAPLFQVTLPGKCQFTITHVKWAMNPHNLHPLLVYIHTSVLHIFDVESHEFLGCISGHGAEITSLVVHRVHPHIVCTTSRDLTARIYDFSIVPDRQQTRPKSAFGWEGTNDSDCRIGECVTILTGGRSGGHEAAILGVDFHPSLPLIVTCGMDHAVRIWYLKPQLFQLERQSPEGVNRLDVEDKPLFSCTLIHDSRVLSVYWLSVDILVSHSAPRVAGDRGGTLAIWQWLSVGRFFPPEAPTYRDPPLRGCISDYRESSSYKIISLSEVPTGASQMTIWRLRHGPPLLAFSVRSSILLLNASNLSPRDRPPLGEDHDRIQGARDTGGYKQADGWRLEEEDMELEGCGVSCDGKIVAGVGAREGMWMWNARA